MGNVVCGDAYSTAAKVAAFANIEEGIVTTA